MLLWRKELTGKRLSGLQRVDSSPDEICRSAIMLHLAWKTLMCSVPAMHVDSLVNTLRSAPTGRLCCFDWTRQVPGVSTWEWAASVEELRRNWSIRWSTGHLRPPPVAANESTGVRSLLRRRVYSATPVCCVRVCASGTVAGGSRCCDVCAGWSRPSLPVTLHWRSHLCS